MAGDVTQVAGGRVLAQVALWAQHLCRPFLGVMGNNRLVFYKALFAARWRTDPGVQPSLGRGFNMAQLENKGAETVLHRLGLEPTVF